MTRPLKFAWGSTLFDAFRGTLTVKIAASTARETRPVEVGSGRLASHLAGAGQIPRGFGTSHRFPNHPSGLHAISITWPLTPRRAVPRFNLPPRVGRVNKD